MNLVVLQEEKILDNISEGHEVTVTRTDGYKYVLSMNRKKGKEVFVYQFGVIKREFPTFNSLINKLSNFDIASIKY